MAHNSESSLHFSEYFRIIRNRLWVIFTIFALTLLSGIYITEQVLPKNYTATATIKIQAADIRMVDGIHSASFQRPIDAVEFQNEYEIMHSSEVLMPVIKQLGLNKTWAKRVYKSANETIPDQDALAYLIGNLTIIYTHGTNLVDVTFKSEIPEESATVANTVITSYKKRRDDEQAQKNDKGANSLKDQIDAQQKVVDAAKDHLEKLRGELDIVFPGAAASATSDLGIDMESQELEARQRDLLRPAQQDA